MKEMKIRNGFRRIAETFNGGKDMKKFSLIVTLLVALTVIFIGCGTDPVDIPRGDKEPLIIEGKNITLKLMGGSIDGDKGTGDYAGTEVKGNKFIMKHGGAARAGSIGFGFEFPAKEQLDGYSYVLVDFKVTNFKAGAVCFTTKINTKMEDPAGYGSNGWSAGTGHGQYVHGFAVGSGLAAGEEGTSPVMKLSLFDGSIWYQYNSYSEDYERASDLSPKNTLAAQPNQNWAVEITNVYFTTTPSKPGEDPFVPVTKVELLKTDGYEYGDITLNAKITPADATKQQTVIWAIFPKATLTVNVSSDGKSVTSIDGVIDVNGDTKLKTGKTPATAVYPIDFDGTSDDYISKTTVSDVGFKAVSNVSVPGDVADDSVWPWEYDPDTTKSGGRNGKSPNIIIAKPDWTGTAPVLPTDPPVEWTEVTGANGKKEKEAYVNVVAVVVDGTAEGMNYTQYDLVITVKSDPTAKLEYNEATSLGAPDSTPQWDIKSVLNGQTTVPQYLMIVCYAPSAKQDGIGWTKWKFQGTHGSADAQVRSANNIALSQDSNGFMYIVLDLKDWDPEYSTEAAKGASAWSGWAQMQLQYGRADLGLISGFMINGGTTLVKPAGAKPLGQGDTSVSGFDAAKSYVCNELPGGLTLK